MKRKLHPGTGKVPGPAKRQRTSQFGLMELAPGKHPNVDIVAIHGINGDREYSWTADNGVLWLKDLLPEKIPNARILTYGYDANTYGQDQLATDYMHDHATTFISKLALLREETSTTERAIIFVAHSSGGILLISALIHSHLAHDGHLKHHHAISQSTHGITFFGTPHQGSAIAELARSLLVIESPFSQISDILLQHLERDSEALQQHLIQYSAISGQYETKFFYEMYDTHVSGRMLKVVPKSSAVVPGAVNAECIGLNKDHVNLVKFLSAADEDFMTVSTTLSLMSNAAVQKISKKLEGCKSCNRTPDGTTTVTEILLNSSQRDATVLSNFPRVNTARFDADSRPGCLEGTRVELLETISEWTEQDISSNARQIFWLSGQAGTGKTTISLTVAGNCQAKGRLGASFFFSRDHAERNDLQLVFPTLAQQLGIFHQPFQAVLAKVFQQDPDVVHVDPKHQFKKLIIQPLNSCDSFPVSTIIVIDALDECKDENPMSKILAILADNIGEVPHLKFFITSRPEYFISFGFHSLATNTQSVILHEIETSVVDHDIERYLRVKFSTASTLYPHLLEPDWPSDEEIKALVVKSGRLFIFAATAMNFILDHTYSDPPNQLGLILRQSSADNTSSTLPDDFLDQLYLQVLLRAFPSITPASRLADLRGLLGAIVLLCYPLSPGALESLLSLRRGAVRTTLSRLHSILVVPDTDKHPIRLIHPSFFDFVTSRCLDVDFWVDPLMYHEQLAIACFTQMKGLKRNICEIEDESKLTNEMEDLPERIQRYIPQAMQYACQHWSFHLCAAGENVPLQELLQEFFHEHLLYWEEVLSLLGCLRQGIRNLQRVLKFFKASPTSPKHLLKTLRNNVQFMVDSFEPIPSGSSGPSTEYSIGISFESSLQFMVDSFEPIPSGSSGPSTEYSIGIPFESNLVVDTMSYVGPIPSSVPNFGPIPSSVPNFGPIPSSVPNFGPIPYSVPNFGPIPYAGPIPYSVGIPNFGPIAFVFNDPIPYLNPIPGEFAHLDPIPSDDRIPFAEPVPSLPLSPLMELFHLCPPPPLYDTAFNASAITDGFIPPILRIPGDPTRILRGSKGKVTSVDFSPDGTTIVSASDGEVRLWDCSTRTLLKELKIELKAAVRWARFFPDGSRIISATSRYTIWIWNVATGTCLRTIQLEDLGSVPQWMPCYTCSPDFNVIVGSKDNDILIWDTATGHLLNTLKGHFSTVRSIAYSHNHRLIASASDDHTIRIWDVVSGAMLSTRTGHSSLVYTIAFSPDSTHIVSGSDDFGVYLWFADSTALFKTLLAHTSAVRSVAFSRDGARIISGSDDMTLRVWDAADGKLLRTIHGSGRVKNVGFSPDGTQYISTTGDSIFLWTAN